MNDTGIRPDLPDTPDTAKLWRTELIPLLQSECDRMGLEAALGLAGSSEPTEEAGQ